MYKNSANFRVLLLLLVFSAWTAVQAQPAADPKPAATGTPVEREAIEKIVREYLLAHPEIVREAMQTLEMREANDKRRMRAENLKKLAPQIYSDPDSPVLGNPGADVTIVVFYDYFCGYCRKTLPDLKSLIAEDKALKVVYKEVPILTEQSIVAAKAALAAAVQGKFEEFHAAMLSSDSASEAVLRSISDKTGIDYQKLTKDMADPAIMAMISRNLELTRQLSIDGTPAYIIGDRLIPGAVDAKTLKQLVAFERAKLKAPENPENSTRTGKNASVN